MAGDVVITGLGAISSLGVGIEEHRSALLSGRRSMGAPTFLNIGGSEPFPVAEIAAGRQFEKLPPHLRRYDSRETRITAEACKEAFRDSGALEFYDNDVALYVGTTSSGVHELEEAWREYKATGNIHPHWDFANQHLAGATTRAMVKYFGLTRQHLTVSTACSSSANALLLAAIGIMEGRFKAAAVLGVDTLSEMVYFGFRSLGLVSPFPTIPFDINRKGLTLGEASACLIMEDQHSALSRGANVYARLLGYGTTSDAHHITAPDPEGSGIKLCVSRALENARLEPSGIDAINAHGTGTPQNDEVEGKVFAEVFGADVPVTATKSFTGHTLGAAGAIEAIFSILTITDGYVPPTLGTKEVGEGLKANIVIGKGLKREIRTVLSTSFGFGGSNASLVFGKFDP